MVTRVESSAGWTAISGPTVTADDASAEFFDAARRGTLLLKCCASCDGWATPVADWCPRCPGEPLGWRAAAGTGQLVTWAVARMPPHPAFADDLPVVSAIVETTEGPWLNLRVIGPAAGLRVGEAVQIGFAHSDEGASYPVAVLPSAGGAS